MQWYLAKLVYRFTVHNGSFPTQFDEQLRLIQAENELHAYQKAQRIGEQEQEKEIEDQPACWSFMEVTELYALDICADGAEVSSQIREPLNVQQFQREIRLKAGYLLNNCTEIFFQNL